MKSKVSKKNNYQTFQDFIDIFLDITNNLPFILFLIVPFLFNQINGYSLIICLPLTCIFILFSSFSWLELKSRYLLQNAPNTTYILRNDPTKEQHQNSNNNLEMFKMLESTIGINCSILILICNLINGLSLHSFVIKWFYEEITVHLFHFLDEDHVHNSCSIQNNSLSLSGRKFLETSINQSLLSESDHHDEHVLFRTKKIMLITELFTNLIYFFYLSFIQLALSKSKIFCIFNRLNFLKIFTAKSSYLPKNNSTKISIFSALSGLFFYLIVFGTLALTLSFGSIRLQSKCEPFFKKQATGSAYFNYFIIGIIICSSSFHSLIFSEFTRLRKIKRTSLNTSIGSNNSADRNIGSFIKKSSKIGNRFKQQFKSFLNVISKHILIVLIIILFVVILNTFSENRNECCVEFLESLLNHENHGLHIIKQLGLTFICIYIFYHSNTKFDSMMKNSYQLIDYLFDDSELIKSTQNKLILKLSEIDSNFDQDHADNDDNDDDTLCDEADKDEEEIISKNNFISNNKGEIFSTSLQKLTNDTKKAQQVKIRMKSSTSFKSGRKIEKINRNDYASNLKKRKFFTMIVLFFLITCAKLTLLSQLDLIYLWSMSFLFINFFTISIILLINYLPYQVLIDYNKNSISNRIMCESSSSSIIFRKRDVETPLIRQEETHNNRLSTIKPIYNKTTRENLSSVSLDLPMSPEFDQDGILIEKAFSQHKHELKHKALSNKSLSFGSNQPSMNSAYRAILAYILFILFSFSLSFYLNYFLSNQPSLFISIFFVVSIISFLVLISIIYLGRNLKETIYANNLFYRSPFVPYPQLVLSFMSTYFILSLGYFILTLFACLLVSFSIILLIAYNIFNKYKFKSIGNDHLFSPATSKINERLNSEWDNISPPSNLSNNNNETGDYFNNKNLDMNGVFTINTDENISKSFLEKSIITNSHDASKSNIL